MKLIASSTFVIAPAFVYGCCWFAYVYYKILISPLFKSAGAGPGPASVFSFLKTFFFFFFLKRGR